MAGRESESDRLREMVERNRLELEELRRELEEIGDEMRQEHIRRARQDRASRTDTALDVNPMCRECLNTCRQPASVRIHHCDRFEPID
jgi:hypothetical protein